MSHVKLVDDLLNDFSVDDSNCVGEAKGMVIARLSQSKKPFEEIIKEIVDGNNFDKEKVSDFHKRITLGFKHHSIEQHTNASIGIEQLSILATNMYVENKRLAAFMERSTRYQDFSNPSYHIPPELGSFKEEYCELMDFLFKTYSEILEEIFLEIKKNFSERGLEINEKKIRKKAFDCARYLLPSSTHTNLAMTANSQTFRSLIIDLRSENNSELNELADKLQSELKKVFPTLISNDLCKEDSSRKNHKNHDLKIVSTKPSIPFEKIVVNNQEFFHIPNNVSLVKKTVNSSELVCFNYFLSEGFNPSLKKNLFLDDKKIDSDLLEKTLEKIFSYNSLEEKPHRSSESAFYWFDSVVDFGAGRDVHRNRMMTWINNPVSPENGFAIPYYLNDSSKKKYLEALEKSFAFWTKIVNNGISREVAQYVLPLATNYRVFITVNARELCHLGKTRTNNSAHFSYREFVHKMIEEVKKEDGQIGKHIPDYFEQELPK